MRNAVVTLLVLLPGFAPARAADPPKKILLIAGTKSHGPGDHEYEKGARLLKHCLDTAPNLKGFTAEVHLDGWPKDERAFDGAATVFLYSDGSDRQEQAHPLLREKRLQTMQALMDRGVGFVAVHYTVFVPAKKGGDQFLDWLGGYFDYENGPKPRGWFSKIQTGVGKVSLPSPKHPVSRGLTPFELREEFYYNMRLRPKDDGLSPILDVALPGEKEEQTVAWALERKNGGRGFGYTGGHFHANWQNENVRRMVLNAFVWTAGGEVPEGGVRSTLPEKPQERGPSSETESDYKPADPRLKAVLVDRSPDESFVALKADTQGRLFVGGREALFVYEPDDKGGYKARRELFRFPPDAWVAGVEVRGDDLYVLTASALYRFPGGRVKRDGLTPERLVWGLPLDLHVSYHCLAWGPEGDLYFNHGDPLLNYGDFQRPDHWGHWTVYGPRGEKTPYTGNGGVFRVRPDGSGFRAVAGGLRGPFGLTFDRHWNLFTNDNDHESRPDLYTPGRLLHVTPHVDFGWPRGWIASKTPERADLVEAMSNTPGRSVPVGMCYYDDPFLPPEYRHNLLQARWDTLTIQRHPIERRGASYAAGELPFLVGKVRARPVGVAVGRGGRVFAAVAYMAGNEASPHYASDLVMITRADDPPAHPFEAYDVTALPAEKLWAELSRPSWERRRAAHTEILRRGGSLLAEAPARLAAAKDDDPAMTHLPWLAAASGAPEAARLLSALAKHPRAEVRLQAVRALGEAPALQAPSSVLEGALADADARVCLAALAAFFDPARELPFDAVASLARSTDTYLRQTATTLLARRATPSRILALARTADAPGRLAAALAAGSRLTVPAPDVAPLPEVPLFYPKGNAFFQTKIRYGDKPNDEVELAKLGRLGSFTAAEAWRTARPDAERQALFDLLIVLLKDPAEPVRLQSAYFLSLLKDARTEPLVAGVFREARAGRVASAAPRAVGKVWAAGPFAAGESPIEGSAVDVSAEVATARGKVAWRELAAGPGGFFLPDKGDYYLFFCLQSVARQPVLLDVAAARAWHNGRLVAADRGAFLLDASPGGNDVLLRVGGGPVSVWYRARSEVVATLPEKLGAALLAQRLKEAGSVKQDAVPPEFLALDWQGEAKKGSAPAGRKLFGTLGCVKCHAVTADQPGGGAPSLTDAGKRFTVAYLVESVLLPNRQVAEPFRSTAIMTKQGVSVSGLVVAETAEAVELLLPDTNRKTIRKKDIEERTTTNVSPMPAGLVKTPAELRDLLAYLLSENPSPP